jgi:hypothetical protein
MDSDEEDRKYIKKCKPTKIMCDQEISYLGKEAVLKRNKKKLKKPSGKCKYCNKPLRAVGSARKNGANHKDWGTREYHKKCWKERFTIIFD